MPYKDQGTGCIPYSVDGHVYTLRDHRQHTRKHISLLGDIRTSHIPKCFTNYIAGGHLGLVDHPPQCKGIHILYSHITGNELIPYRSNNTYQLARPNFFKVSIPWLMFNHGLFNVSTSFPIRCITVKTATHNCFNRDTMTCSGLHT